MRLASYSSSQADAACFVQHHVSPIIEHYGDHAGSSRSDPLQVRAGHRTRSPRPAADRRRRSSAAARRSFGDPPNTNVCPVCLGLPGALPVLNRKAVEFAVLAAMALNCQVSTRRRSSRARITSIPTCPRATRFRSTTSRSPSTATSRSKTRAGTKNASASRALHLEEDAGKSLHDGLPDCGRVDLDRPEPLAARR